MKSMQTFCLQTLDFCGILYETLLIALVRERLHRVGSTRIHRSE